MNFQFYLEKLFDSKVFQEFVESEKSAYPCSAFFIIDKEGNDDKQHFDYYLPDVKKMFSFKMEGEIEKLPIEMSHNDIPTKISLNHNFDFNDIEKLIQEEMEKEKMNNKIQKIILSLQNLNGKDSFIATVFISALGIIKAQIDLEDMKLVNFEKKSFLDMIQIKKNK